MRVAQAVTPPPTCTASGEARGLERREDLRRADARLAVQDDRLVLRQVAQGGAEEELVLRDQRRAGDRDDLVLVRLADVDEVDVLAGVHPLLELARR